jgi:hypothetical protein
MGAEFLVQELGADFTGDEPGDGFDEEGDGGVFERFIPSLAMDNGRNWGKYHS